MANLGCGRARSYQRGWGREMRCRAILLAVCLANPVATAERPPIGVAVFDYDPNHLWNRMYGCLLVREHADGTYYGADALDPLLWANTRHLLSGDSHRNSVVCLDEFLRRHGERVVQDPLKRALLQRDLWAVFDWAAAATTCHTSGRIWKFGYRKLFGGWRSRGKRLPRCRITITLLYEMDSSRRSTIRAIHRGRFCRGSYFKKEHSGFASVRSPSNRPRKFTSRGALASSCSCGCLADEK